MHTLDQHSSTTADGSFSLLPCLHRVALPDLASHCLPCLASCSIVACTEGLASYILLASYGSGAAELEKNVVMKGADWSPFLLDSHTNHIYYSVEDDEQALTLPKVCETGGRGGGGGGASSANLSCRCQLGNHMCRWLQLATRSMCLYTLIQQVLL